MLSSGWGVGLGGTGVERKSRLKLGSGFLNSGRGVELGDWENKKPTPAPRKYLFHEMSNCVLDQREPALA